MAEANVTFFKRGWRVIALVALIALSGVWVWWSYFDTYHFATVQDGILYRDGVRSHRELATAYRRAHFKTIVSLVSDEEQTRPEFQDEAAMARYRGVELIRIPVKHGGEPTRDDIDRFLAITRDKSRWPILVHCAQGVQRTGMMVAAYQIQVLGYDKQKAMDSILEFGKGPERAQAVRAFIDRWYTPPTLLPTAQAPTTATE